MKRIGGIKKKFLTKSTINEAITYLCRPAKRNKWTLSTKGSWEILLKDKDGLVDLIYNQLNNQSYEPGKFKVFKRFENKKERIIYASYPKDQIVDYVLNKCLEYVFIERKKIISPNSYGSIKGKGQHELRKRIIDKVKGRNDLYVAICDTRHYYPTINHGLLLRFINQHVKDPWVIWLTNITLNRMNSRIGLALGLASSNILGHIYHAAIDWIMITDYNLKDYYRFCDDKVIIHSDKKYLHSVVRALKSLVENKLEQSLKPNWKIVHCEKQRFEFLGAMINSKNAIINNYSRRRIERKFKKEINRSFNYRVDSDRVLRTWAGIRGGLKDLEVRNLIKWWALNSSYKEFFRRLWQAMIYVEQGRKGLVPYGLVEINYD